MFMNNMEDRRKNLASKLWILQTRENPGSLPSTFDACEYQLRASIHSCQLVENLEFLPNAIHPTPRLYISIPRIFSTAESKMMH